MKIDSWTIQYTKRLSRSPKGGPIYLNSEFNRHCMLVACTCQLKKLWKRLITDNSNNIHFDFLLGFSSSSSAVVTKPPGAIFSSVKAVSSSDTGVSEVGSSAGSSDVS